jgi:hypothetical protein
MRPLDPARVIAASNGWRWFPPEAEVVDTPDYLLVLFPEHFSSAAEVMRTTSDRPFPELAAEVAEEVRRRRRATYAWWVRLDSRPDDLDRCLVDLGGKLEETLGVLARPLEDPPELDPATDVELRVVDDEQTLRDATAVDVAVFGGEIPPEDTIEVRVRRTQELLAGGAEVELVAYRDGLPVGHGGATVVDDVLRLWNGCVVEQARGRGVYRALLGERLRWGAQQEATMALVKARVTTSGPILTRAGFASYGEERSYSLNV